jgi:hypothetical protein
VQDLSPRTQISANSVGDRILTRTSGKAIRAETDRRPDRAKPHVTKVIGVFDPYTWKHVCIPSRQREFRASRPALLASVKSIAQRHFVRPPV